MITSLLSTVLREGTFHFLLDSFRLGASTPIALHRANHCFLCEDSTVHHPPEGHLRDSSVTPGDSSVTSGEGTESERIRKFQRPLSIRCHGDTQLLQLSLFSTVVTISIYRLLLYHSCLANHRYPFPKSWHHQRWHWRNPAWPSFSFSFQCIYPTI